MSTLKRWLQAFIREVQKVLLFVFLTLLYAVGFACTRLLLVFFARRSLLGGLGDAGGRWQDAVGYNPDESARPS